jgi:NAD(P)-dependent dehydrogenase (short-subunit alcohol dehydrogenase family)
MPAVALVTGGNRGIGLGITQRLLADGFAVSFVRFLAIAAGLRFLRFLLFAVAGTQLTAWWHTLWQ